MRTLFKNDSEKIRLEKHRDHTNRRAVALGAAARDLRQWADGEGAEIPRRRRDEAGLVLVEAEVMQEYIIRSRRL
jgi:hypothetical protein